MEYKVKLNIALQIYGDMSDGDKKAFLEALLGKNDKQNVTSAPVKNDEFFLQNKFTETPITCPHCKSNHVVKSGHNHGNQRYICRKCKKTFGLNHGTIFKHTKKNITVWQKYIQCMIEKKSLRKSALECGIDLTTAFYWRHKILDALQNMMADVRLNGVVEADETSLGLSFKGNHKESHSFTMPRESYKRATSATKRGLSLQKVCISCGINLDGLSIAKATNLGKPCVKDIDAVLGNKVEKDTVFITV